MLLSHETFARFAHLPMADPTTHTLALYCFSASSRDEVDAVAAAALAAGGTEADGAEDHGFMYSRSFFDLDLDGHGWQVMWMDPAAWSRAPRRSRRRCRTPTPRPDPQHGMDRLACSHSFMTAGSARVWEERIHDDYVSGVPRG
jgi:hypothetical protein